MHPATLIDLFLINREAAGIAPSSLTWYRQQLSDYLRWLDTHPGLTPWSVHTLTAYLAEQRKRYAPRTVLARYTALNALLNYAETHEILPRNPMTKKIKAPTVPKKPAPAITIEELHQLCDSIVPAAWVDYRDLALIHLVFFSGLRASEALALTLEDFDFAAQLVMIRSGKGNKSDYAPLSPDYRTIFQAYLTNRPSAPATQLWCRAGYNETTAGALQYPGLLKMIKRRCLAAGLPPYTPHALRHGLAMWGINNGMRMESVSKALRHASQRTTEMHYAYLKTAAMLTDYNTLLAKQQAEDNERRQVR